MSLGDKMSEADVDYMLKQAKIVDGKIDYENFVQTMIEEVNYSA